MTKILAGIVTFNPELDRLNENVNSVLSQADEVIVVDNGSKNVNDIKELFPGITIISLEKNMGIAYALNEIGMYAISNRFDWFLTLDQDTIIYNDLIEKYSHYLNLPQVGMLTCLFQDINKQKLELENFNYREVEKCITSAALVKTEVFDKSNKFDEKMFIDLVDYDINYHFKELGYITYQINKVGFLHEIGNAKEKSFLGKKFYVYNHSPFRKYYMVRNALYLDRKYGKRITHGNGTFIRDEYVRVILFENSKFKKIWSMTKGLIDGLTMKVDKYGK